MSERKRMQFGGEGVDSEALIQEVLRGEKTATAADAADYNEPWGDYDSGGWEAGDLVEIWDSGPKLRCLIRVTEVYTTPFGVTPEKLWREEVCKSAEHFRQVHRDCWPELDMTDERPIVAVHFRLESVSEA
jgi:uncharacterized protein YhfF